MSRRTPGPWALRGYQIRAEGGLGKHVADYRISVADGLLIAAAPEMFEMLLGACANLDAAENSSRSHSGADYIRRELARLGLIVLGKDEIGHVSDRVDPADTDPEQAP